MIRVRFAPLAEEEAADAAEWYDARRPGLGGEFLSALAHAVRQLRALPLSGPPITALTVPVPLRRVLVPGFPYALCYAVFKTHVQVLAVAHTSRMPGYWLARVTAGRRPAKGRS